METSSAAFLSEMPALEPLPRLTPNFSRTPWSPLAPVSDGNSLSASGNVRGHCASRYEGLESFVLVCRRM